MSIGRDHAPDNRRGALREARSHRLSQHFPTHCGLALRVGLAVWSDHSYARTDAIDLLAEGQANLGGRLVDNSTGSRNSLE